MSEQSVRDYVDRYRLMADVRENGLINRTIDIAKKCKKKKYKIIQKPTMMLELWTNLAGMCKLRPYFLNYQLTVDLITD
jgi:hypothetical protein